MTASLALPPIHTVQTNKGLTAWLVQSPRPAMLSIDITFNAGSAYDPDTQHGLANLTAALLDEGAGDLTARQFQEELQKIGATFSSGADIQHATVRLATLLEHKERAFELLGMALQSPRFDDDAIKRVRDAILAGLKREEEDPAAQSRNLFGAALFGDHPYAHSVDGSAESVSRLTPDHIRTFYKNHFTRANMTISAVGDVTQADLINLIDTYIAPLPEGSTPHTITQAPQDQGPSLVKKQMPVPQSNILIGHLGIDRHHPDYFASYFMNYILGGGGFSARLMEEVREKRGLAYSVYSRFSPLPHQGSFEVVVQTNNDDATTSINLIKSEIEKIKTHGVTEKEFEDAMKYLTGSFPLRIDSNRKVLGYLSTMQSENLGKDYLSTWVSNIQALTRDDINRVAQGLLHPDNLITVIVGDGKALE